MRLLGTGVENLGHLRIGGELLPFSMRVNAACRSWPGRVPATARAGPPDPVDSKKRMSYGMVRVVQDTGRIHIGRRRWIVRLRKRVDLNLLAVLHGLGQVFVAAALANRPQQSVALVSGRRQNDVPLGCLFPCGPAGG